MVVLLQDFSTVILAAVLRQTFCEDFLGGGWPGSIFALPWAQRYYRCSQRYYHQVAVLPPGPQWYYHWTVPLGLYKGGGARFLLPLSSSSRIRPPQPRTPPISISIPGAPSLR